MKYVLAADIGGTYTRLAVYKGKTRKLYHRYENVRFPSLTALLHEFRTRHGLSFSKVSLAVAGPVHNGIAKMPNLAWHVDVDLVKHALLVKDVTIVNDAFAAMVALDDDDCVTIVKGRAEKATRALLGPGTGLGSAIAAWDDGLLPMPAEFGHADFAPATIEQERFLDYLRRRYGHVSNERVASGPGLVSLYYYLREQKAGVESDAMRKAIDAASSPAKAIVDAAVAGTDGLAEVAARQWASMLASIAGSYALATSATGGVYLFGSLANRLLPFLKEEEFAAAFARKGRLRPFLQKIPIKVVKDPDVVLKGAFLLA